MRPSFGFVLRAVAAEEPTVSRLAELLGVTEQATSRLVDDMVTLGFLQRSEPRGDRGQKRLHPSPAGKRIRERALAESRELEDELRQRFGDAQVDALRTLLIDFVERHRGGDELGARRWRFSDPSDGPTRSKSGMGYRWPDRAPRRLDTGIRKPRPIIAQLHPGNSTEEEEAMTLQIDELAPDFEAETTEGTVRFHDWIGDSWAVLFSHPRNFTPVCTTELGYLAAIKPEFDRRDVKIIGLSVDPVDRHAGGEVTSFDAAEDVQEDFEIDVLRESGQSCGRHVPSSRTSGNAYHGGPGRY